MLTKKYKLALFFGRTFLSAHPPQSLFSYCDGIWYIRDLVGLRFIEKSVYLLDKRVSVIRDGIDLYACFIENIAIIKSEDLYIFQIFISDKIICAYCVYIGRAYYGTLLVRRNSGFKRFFIKNGLVRIIARFNERDESTVAFRLSINVFMIRLFQNGGVVDKIFKAE